MRIVRWLFTILLLSAAGFGAAYYMAGRADGPAISIDQPAIIGQDSPLAITVSAPGGQLSSLSVQIAQDERIFPLVSLDSAAEGVIAREGDEVRVQTRIGRKHLPELQDGSAVITVTASRPVLRDLRQVSAQAVREVPVRLTPPRIAVISTHHYVNVGGTEMVVYRVTPDDATTGVRVGEAVFPGYPAEARDPALRVAFFALAHDHQSGTPIEVFAVDAAGNQARAQFDHRIFPKRFRSSRIPLDDRFLSRVVPAILQSAPDLGGADADLLPAFLKINNDLRRANNDTIAALAQKSAPRILWSGAFERLGGSQVESSFADFRTYLYGGKEVDRQVHLGFDLAKTVNAPVLAANDGIVLFAGELGIYGQTVVLDHGMGVQSLYAHLSSLAVNVGDRVGKGHTLGASGQTGLAGGDHLHFSMLVGGRFVNAIEWWDPGWIEDRVVRKLREAGAAAPPVEGAS